MFEKPFDEEFLKNLVSFLFSVKWMFSTINTQYLNEDVIIENREFLETLSESNLNDLLELETSANDHPECLKILIENVNKFKLSYETIITDSWKSTPVKKVSIKKQYEIDHFSKVINSVCKNEVTQLIDFGSGLGYLGHNLFEQYGYKVLGLEGCDDRVEKAIERQNRFHPKSCGKVKHAQHFITLESSEFILSQIEDNSSPLAIFGLHGCGDLTVTAIKLFLNMSRVKKLIFMPCCYHKMSVTESQFNFFPLSDELKSISKQYPPFMNRPFLRLAGQQSPAKWKEMSQRDHWIHGKNMFERALVEALLYEDETMKRINNITIIENRVTMDDIFLKYQLLEKSSGKSKNWNEGHRQKFHALREKYPDGEEMSENLFCLQTMIQNNCESLVLIDRLRYIHEEASRMNMKLQVSVKKLQNDKLTPRCLIIIAEKC